MPEPVGCSFASYRYLYTLSRQLYAKASYGAESTTNAMTMSAGYSPAKILRIYALFLVALDSCRLALSDVLSPVCSSGVECDSTILVVGDAHTKESTWRMKLLESKPSLRFVGPHYDHGTWHAGYESFTVEMVAHGCPGYVTQCKSLSKLFHSTCTNQLEFPTAVIFS